MGCRLEKNQSVETGIDIDLKTLKLVLLRIVGKITTDKKLRQTVGNKL